MSPQGCLVPTRNPTRPKPNSSKALHGWRSTSSTLSPRIFLVERDLERIRELKALKAQHPSPRSITVKEGDANAALQEWLASGIDWSRHRSVVFLDPFGMQVPWSTIEALAKTKAMELIINFPLGMAIQRLLPKSGEYSARLANVAGHILWLTGVARTCLRGGRGPLRAQSAEGHRIGTKAAGLVSKPLAHRVWPRIDGAPHQGHSSKPSLLLDLGGPKRDG